MDDRPVTGSEKDSAGLSRQEQVDRAAEEIVKRRERELARAAAIEAMPLGPAQPPSAQPARTGAAAPDSPYWLIVVGVLIGGLTFGSGFGLAAADVPAAVVLGFAAISFCGLIMVIVGSVAAGVRLGMRHHRYEADRESSN